MRDTLDEFKKFHNSNPQVYAAFAQIARRQLSRQGPPYRKGCLKAIDIIQQIRRDRRIKTTTMRTLGRKIDNNYAAYYARLFMHREPDCVGVFAVRSIKTSEKALTLFGEKGTGHISKRRGDH